MKIAEIIQMMVEDSPPMRLEAYDGSGFGPADAKYTLRLKNERGLRYVATAPGDLGRGRAYVAGALDVDGGHEGDGHHAAHDSPRRAARYTGLPCQSRRQGG